MFIVSSIFLVRGSLAVTLLFVEHPLQPRERPPIMLYLNSLRARSISMPSRNASGCKSNAKRGRGGLDGWSLLTGSLWIEYESDMSEAGGRFQFRGGARS
jgi:hypothetical protein